MKKLWSMVLAVALTAVMVLGTCCAEKVFTDGIGDGFVTAGEGSWAYDLQAAGADCSEIANITVTFTVSSLDSGFGGGFIANSSNGGNGWNSVEWGNADAAKAISAVATDDASGLEFTITRDFTGIFGDEEDANGLYNNLCIQSWWGADINVTNVECYNAAGTLIYAAVEADGGAQTADMTSIAILAGVAALALVAVVASKKVNA